MDAIPDCVVGLAVGPSTLERAKYWLDRETHSERYNFNLSDLLLKRENIITPHSISNPAKVGMVLRFSKPTKVGRLTRVLRRNLPQHGHDILLEKIEEAVGGKETTLPKGDEISFYWLDSDELYILHNGDVYDVIYVPHVSRSLLDLFVGSQDRILSHELFQSTCQRLPFVEDR